jgi:hypothetical protein
MYDRPVADLSVLEWTSLFLCKLPACEVRPDSNPQFAADVHSVRSEHEDGQISF